MRVRVKICGITRVADARAAVAAGADALGFNFHPSSPRYVDPARARDIIAELPPFVATVGLFVDASSAAVCEAIATSGVQWAQFHGDETDAQCRAGGRPFIKAIGVAGPVDGAALEREFPNAAAFQLDSLAVGVRGGSGTTFDWAWWPVYCTRPLILAGGLRPDNVADAILRTHPYAVDVSSGVEGPTKGIKDEGKIMRFIEEVRRAGGRN
jgi:phosphoribosylanthranilate isomerase